MCPIDYCFIDLKPLPNLLTVVNSESRKELQFPLLVIGVSRSTATAWKALTRACLSPKTVTAAQAGWGNRYKAGECFTPVPLRCSSATGQPAQGRHRGCGVGGHLLSSPWLALNTHFLVFCIQLLTGYFYSAVFVRFNFPDSLL